MEAAELMSVRRLALELLVPAVIGAALGLVYARWRFGPLPPRA